MIAKPYQLPPARYLGTSTMLRIARPSAACARAAPALNVAARSLAMKAAARAPKPFTSANFAIEELHMNGTVEQVRRCVLSLRDRGPVTGERRAVGADELAGVGCCSLGREWGGCQPLVGHGWSRCCCVATLFHPGKSALVAPRRPPPRPARRR